MESLDDIILKLKNYSSEPNINEPIYIKYIVNFLKRDLGYVEIPFVEYVKPFTVTFFLVRNGLECRADTVSSFPFFRNTIAINCSGDYTYLFILSKKSFLVNFKITQLIKEKLYELKKTITDREIYEEEEMEGGFSFLYDDDPNFLGMKIIKELIMKPWNQHSLIFDGFIFTIYTKKEKGMTWLYIKKDEIEKYFEKLVKTPLP